jgi:lipopolysaccharide/colanic/teichoic acid biosynthesis glycosyltransferase
MPSADGFTSPRGAAQRHAGMADVPVPEPQHGLPAWQPGIGPSAGRRCLDVVVAALLLGLSLPLLLIISVAASLSTGGSPIFRQLRVGQGGIPFTLYKFRTMRLGVSGPEVTAPDDPRVTRLGALLRRTSIDELPQMVNVLLGHMTLVGPRPESVALAARYPGDCQFIFRYRPGVTGPSQVLVRDEKVLGNVGDVGDVEAYFLSELVPHRVATDLSYLSRPTLALTVRWLVGTALYLAGLAWRRAPEPRPMPLAFHTRL